MDVFEVAAFATILQVCLWLLLEVVKTLKRIWQMVRNGKEKPGHHRKGNRVK